MITLKNRRTLLLVALQCGWFHSPLFAQAAPASPDATAPAAAGLGEIVVTAEKRESSLQRTPIAITAISGDSLMKKGINTIEAIGGIVPAVTIVNEAGTTKVNIRGLGLNSFGPGIEGAVAVYANGIYLAHAPEIGSQFLDVQRLEVLRGPQGTLYGRNSTGGAVNIIPNAPTDDFETGGVVSYGNYDHVLLDGHVSGAVIPDVLKVRFAGQFERYRGSFLNVPNGDHYGGLKQGGFRATAEYTPSDRIKLTVSADYSHGDDTSVVNVYGGYGRTQAYAEQLAKKAVDPVAAAAAAALVTTEVGLAITDFGGVANQVGPDGKAIDPQHLYQDTAPVTERTYYGASAVLEAKVSDSITFKSISGYRHGEFLSLTDGDRTTAFLFNYTQLEHWRSLSEEAQFLGTTGKLSWIAGGYYLNDKEPLIEYILPTPFGTFQPYGSDSTNAVAAFGQASFAFTPKLKLTVGGRYSYEVRKRQEFLDVTSTDALEPDRVSFSKFTPKATLDYEPSRNLTVYATISNGFKSGGFIVTAGQGPVKPETLWDYEAGVKARFFDNHLQLAVAGYHYDYKNLQVPVNLGLVFQTQNAASATVNGGELEVTALPMKNLRISGTAAIIDGKFKKYISEDPVFPELGLINLRGNQLPFNSKYAFYIDADYTIPLSSGAKVELDADYNWKSKQFFDAYNLKNTYQPAVGIVGARVRYTAASSRWYIEAYGKNLANKFYFSQTSTDGEFFGQQILGEREPPRMYGIRIGFNY